MHAPTYHMFHWRMAEKIQQSSKNVYSIVHCYSAWMEDRGNMIIGKERDGGMEEQDRKGDECEGKRKGERERGGYGDLFKANDNTSYQS